MDEYTYKENGDQFEILEPDGTFLVFVDTVPEAERLVYHLNRLNALAWGER